MRFTDSINTPGAYYALAYVLSACLIIYTNPRKSKWYVSIPYQVLYFVSLSWIMYVTRDVIVWFIPLSILYFTLIFLDLRLHSNLDIRLVLYYAIRAFITGEFMASFHWMIYYFSVKTAHYPTGPVANVIMLVLVHGVVLFFFYRLNQRMPHAEEYMTITRKELLAAALICVGIYSLSNIYYLIGEKLFGGLYAQEIFVIRTLVDAGGVAILYAVAIQLGEVYTRLERDRLLDAFEMQRANYELLEQSMEIVNIKYHDLKHQIAIIREGVESGEAVEYLDKMEQEIRIYEAQNKTGNKILDTILTAKSIYCQNHWIEMTVVADGSALSFMEPMDISALFGNIIDNAIESVEKIGQKEKRLIHLAVAHQKGFVRIRLENCYEQQPKIVNGQIKSTKKDSRNHGYGLKSIEAIVRKYGGSVTINAKEGWFEQRILIPSCDKDRAVYDDQETSL
ncbi:MAG: GHKL domain-containing protein [Lachnospiraceae bacterium]|nr:GHKL domain-containing protein [Lachnospiraceae bacterium]